MRDFRSLLFLTLLVPISVPMAAQQPPRDPRAIRVIQQSLSAMGGGAAAASIQDGVARGQFRPLAGSGLKPATFIWKHSWAGGSYEFRRETAMDHGPVLVVSGHGSPRALDPGGLRVLPEDSALEPAIHLPRRVFVAALIDPQYKFEAPSDAVLNDGRKAVRVHFELAARDPQIRAASSQDWFFDPTTWLPLRLEFRVTSLPDPSWTRSGPESLAVAVEYSDFRAVGAVLVPFTMTIRARGSELLLATLESVTFNSGVRPSEFDAPGSGGGL